MRVSEMIGRPGTASVEANRRAVANRDVLTGREVFFGEEEVIVSKTDLKGLITYANPVFMRISGFTESELIGAPHSILRHPQMPKCVFKFLWDTVAKGEEVFAYVINKAKNGDHYWVFAHVTPTFDASGRIVGYHSNRRVPDRAEVEKITPVYASLVDVEKRAGGKDAVDAGLAALIGFVEGTGMDYSQLVFTL